MTAGEVWRPVVGAEGRYEVSSLGRVRSLLRKVPQVLKPTVGTHGYMTLYIYADGKRRLRSVHQLVAEAFIGPRPDGVDVRHLNGVKSDCRAVNLAFGSRSQNMLDAVEHRQNVNSQKTHCGVCDTPYDAANT